MLSSGGDAVIEEDRAERSIWKSGNGVAECLSIRFIAAAPDGVVESIETEGGDLLILLEVEGGDISSGADWLVVDSVDIKGGRG